MFDLLKKTTAVATLSVLPVAALAQSGSPEMSVDSNPDEEVVIVEEDPTGSLRDTSKAEQGEEAYDDEVAQTGDADGSLYDGDGRTERNLEVPD
jgi:hypothetical protein